MPDVQEDHAVNTWVFASLFSACAAYNSPELRVIMTEACRRLEIYRQDIMQKPRVDAKQYA